MNKMDKLLDQKYFVVDGDIEDTFDTEDQAKKYIESQLEDGYILEEIYETDGGDYEIYIEANEYDCFGEHESCCGLASYVIRKDEYVDEEDIEDDKLYVYYDESDGDTRVRFGADMKAELVTSDVVFDEDVYASEVYTYTI